MALNDAAELLGVSEAQLNLRVETGGLPEAFETDDGSLAIPREALSAVAHREGWIVDLRAKDESPSPEFSEMLERLLGLGERLTAETAARQVAEAELERANTDLAKAERRAIELTSVIESLEAESVRLGSDLAAAKGALQASDAVARERFEAILDMQTTTTETHRAHQAELEHHRRQERDLRDRAEAAQAAMGWWSRRRYQRR